MGMAGQNSMSLDKSVDFKGINQRGFTPGVTVVVMRYFIIRIEFPIANQQEAGGCSY